MAKPKTVGLKSTLLTRIRKEITVVETKKHGLKLYRVSGKDTETLYAETLRTAQLFANQSRLDLARSIVKRDPRPQKEVLINI